MEAVFNGREVVAYLAGGCVAGPRLTLAAYEDRIGVTSKRRICMTIHFQLAPLLALIAGIVILLAPKLMRFVIAAYLIIFGLIGLFNIQV